jgi:methylmalonyl-CoA mutase N-terminal domain/subunit
VNAGIRFMTEMCKMRAFVDLWDEICESATASRIRSYRRFRYGVQVNSLGLTEQQPENNVYRILIEMLAVVLSKKARARAVQLAGLERGAGPAAALGPAMVAADAADHGLRDRPAGIRRPFRRRTPWSTPRSRP